jgi:hypothetical protein
VTFRVAQAQLLGTGEGRLRGDDLTRPWRGVRSRERVSTLVGRLQALTLILPDDAVFSHVTAAQLLKLPLPLGCDDRSIHVMTPPGSAQVTRRGVVGHRGAPAGVLTVKGLRVSDPPSTWLDLAAGWQVEDLVAAGDAVLGRYDDGLATVTQAVAAATGRRGARAARQSLALLRTGSRSPMESRARLVMLRGGLPEPELNVDVHDPHTGEWLAQPDFVWREQRVIAEFQGDHHRTDRAQWQADIVRVRRLQEAGWRVVLLTADDVLRHPDRLVDVLRPFLT